MCVLRQNHQALNMENNEVIAYYDYVDYDDYGGSSSIHCDIVRFIAPPIKTGNGSMPWVFYYDVAYTTHQGVARARFFRTKRDAFAWIAGDQVGDHPLVHIVKHNWDFSNPQLARV
jgi:hypothetical protein